MDRERILAIDNGTWFSAKLGMEEEPYGRVLAYHPGFRSGAMKDHSVQYDKRGTEQRGVHFIRSVRFYSE